MLRGLGHILMYPKHGSDEASMPDSGQAVAPAKDEERRPVARIFPECAGSRQSGGREESLSDRPHPPRLTDAIL